MAAPADPGQTRASLLERLRDGTDAVGWRDFFDRYWRAMYAFARRSGCTEQTAEDVVQDALLEVFRRRQVFRYDPARGRFRNWLFTLVRQKLALHRRCRGPAPRPEAAAGGAARDNGPETAWEQVFETALLVALLDVVRTEVSPQTYQAFELSALHEMPAAQVARLTGLSRNAVYLARRRVLGRLRELGSPYQQSGQLQEKVKELLRLYPSPSVERALTARVERTLSPPTGLRS